LIGLDDRHLCSIDAVVAGQEYSSRGEAQDGEPRFWLETIHEYAREKRRRAGTGIPRPEREHALCALCEEL